MQKPLLISLLLLMNISCFAQSAADLILSRTKAWTGSTVVPWAEALAISGNRIVAVGTDDAILKLRGEKTQVLELPGCLVIPGFIDNHTHFLSGGLQLQSIDLRDAKTEKEFAERIHQKARSLTPGRWITDGNWDHESWPGAKLPTKALIDPFTE